VSQERCNEAWANAVVTYCEVYGITVTPPSCIDWSRLRDNVYHSILTPEERDDRPCPRQNFCAYCGKEYRQWTTKECRCPSCKRKVDARSKKKESELQ
jgi:DNA-directed RNA polymerase subunit RPC12/RpoP